VQSRYVDTGIFQLFSNELSEGKPSTQSENNSRTQTPTKNKRKSILARTPSVPSLSELSLSKAATPGSVRRTASLLVEKGTPKATPSKELVKKGYATPSGKGPMVKRTPTIQRKTPLLPRSSSLNMSSTTPSHTREITYSLKNNDPKDHSIVPIDENQVPPSPAKSLVKKMTKTPLKLTGSQGSKVLC
jgi:hypothetical protein